MIPSHAKQACKIGVLLKYNHSSIFQVHINGGAVLQKTHLDTPWGGPVVLDSTVKELVKELVSALENKSLADRERLALELHVDESARQHEKERQELEAQIQGLERSIQEREQTITELQVR